MDMICVSDDWCNDLIPPGMLAELDDSPFLRRCREGCATRAELEIFLVQQYHYARHFTRYLCALLANLPNEADRAALTENLFEEMGLSALNSVPHSQIYREMLAALHLDPNQTVPLDETEALVRTMLQLSSDADPMRGLGALCLGAEAIVPHVYRQIMHGLLCAGFPEEHLQFFPLHITGDDEHALTMKRIIDREIAANPAARGTLLEAARESIGMRAALFTAITPHLTRETARSEAQVSYSSKHFALTRAVLSAAVPHRLHHPQVAGDIAAAFSKERRHGVAIVDLPSQTISMTLGQLRVGQETRRHRHNYETLLYVLRGRGYTWIEDRKVEWSAGDAVYVPVWAWHCHGNADSSAEAEYLACENAPLLQNLGNLALREEAPVHGDVLTRMTDELPPALNGQ